MKSKVTMDSLNGVVCFNAKIEEGSQVDCGTKSIIRRLLHSAERVWSEILLAHWSGMHCFHKPSPVMTDSCHT